MATPKNPCGKTRGVNDPYEVWVNRPSPDDEPLWEWRMLKKYQSPEGERANPYARWFCAVKGPGTFDSYDMGDTYVRDIKGYGLKLSDKEREAHVAAHPWKEYK